MKDETRKKRIEIILKNSFSPKILLVRDDSIKHMGHGQVSRNAKETHFFIKMVLSNCTISKVNLHRKVYNLLDNEFTAGLHSLELDIKSS